MIASNMHFHPPDAVAGCENTVSQPKAMFAHLECVHVYLNRQMLGTSELLGTWHCMYFRHRMQFVLFMYRLFQWRNSICI